jgi:hypothetical protein
VSLDVACLDRIYLNGYLPTVQVPGQVVQFLQHRGFPNGSMFHRRGAAAGLRGCSVSDVSRMQSNRCQIGRSLFLDLSIG